MTSPVHSSYKYFSESCSENSAKQFTGSELRWIGYQLACLRSLVRTTTETLEIFKRIKFLFPVKYADTYD